MSAGEIDMKKLGLMYAGLLACLAMIVSPVLSQADCPLVVTQALAAIDDNCQELGRNTACYGYRLVEADFFDGATASFDAPSDRADLVTLRSLRTAALDEATQQWGVALMHLQADIPNLSPGQAVTFIVMGDASIENRVPPDQAQQTGPPITATLAADTTARERPSIDSTALLNLPSGSAWPADAIAPDGDWVRMWVGTDISDTAWVPRSAVAGDQVMNLAVVDPDAYAPMQAFYFTTGIGAPRCREAPDSITIRSPQDQFVTLNINGADVRIGSTITLRSSAENTAVFTVLEGTLELPDGRIIDEWESVDVATGEDGTVTSFGEARPASDDERDVAHGIDERLASNRGEGRRLHAITDMDGMDDMDDMNGMSDMDDEVIHIVQQGDTLFDIAMQYRASMQAIVDVNGVQNPSRIPAGTRLVIPDAGSGFAGLRQPERPPATRPPSQPPATGAGCEGFRATSPLQGLAYGDNRFFWDAAPNADAYRVTVVNNENGRTVSANTTAPTTNVSINTDGRALGPGFSFGWYVEALRGRSVICTTDRVSIPREAPPQTGPPIDGLTASVNCSNLSPYDYATVTWSNAAGGSIDIMVSDMGSGTSYTKMGTSGSETVYSSYYSYSIDGLIVTDGVSTISFGGCVP
ncbi:MAG: LysM peptidoglycan-binding domain-containing protein [Anaerolineaceae bacterium]|nr:MAG: LysM peptidoglycan-binding domain-containing protein [Anaerolineaceae bacterium]